MKKLTFIFILLFPFAIFAESAKENIASEISKHYSALPNLYRLYDVTKENVSDKITRQYIIGARSMFVKWTFKKNAVIPMHFHSTEQITWITQGAVKVVSQGKEFIVNAGDVIIFPAYVPHEFHALSDNTIDIDFFTPVREDWLTGKIPAYIQKVQDKP